MNKVKKYDELAKAHGARVLAFAVESYGAFGDHATSIMQMIRNAFEVSHGEGIHDLRYVRLPQLLAVTLQKGNALVARSGALRAREAAASRLAQC